MTGRGPAECSATMSGRHVYRVLGGGIRACVCGAREGVYTEALEDDVPRGREETSQQAFDVHQQSGRRSTLQQQVLDYVREHGGATSDEVEVGLGLTHQTASARMNDLKRANLVVKSGERRPTRQGRNADVYRAV